eukprot:scaffold94762_cov62-Phaeocystis_antarctica.AAC.7
MYGGVSSALLSIVVRGLGAWARSGAFCRVRSNTKRALRVFHLDAAGSALTAPCRASSSASDASPAGSFSVSSAHSSTRLNSTPPPSLPALGCGNAPHSSATSRAAAPNTKMVKTASSSVACTMASESLSSRGQWLKSMPSPCASSAAAARAGRPPQRAGKSRASYEAAASAKATPPRSPENQMHTACLGRRPSGACGARRRASAPPQRCSRVASHSNGKTWRRPRRQATRATRVRSQRVWWEKMGKAISAIPR